MRTTALQAIVGSKAYGLNHADSDTDRMAIVVAPTAEVAGIDWSGHSETWSNAGPTGDDTTQHEIGKFLRLIIKGNPTLFELLFMDEYEILTPVGSALLSIRDELISTNSVYYPYYNYAKAQIRVVSEKENYKPKMARHALRIARQGRQLLLHGDCEVRVPNPDEYWQLTEMPKEDMLTVLQQELDLLNHARDNSVLREIPNKSAAVKLLTEIRNNNVLESLLTDFTKEY